MEGKKEVKQKGTERRKKQTFEIPRFFLLSKTWDPLWIYNLREAGSRAESFYNSSRRRYPRRAPSFRRGWCSRCSRAKFPRWCRAVFPSFPRQCWRFLRGSCQRGWRPLRRSSWKILSGRDWTGRRIWCCFFRLWNSSFRSIPGLFLPTWFLWRAKRREERN